MADNTLPPFLRPPSSPDPITANVLVDFTHEVGLTVSEDAAAQMILIDAASGLRLVLAIDAALDLALRLSAACVRLREPKP
jgi:hypothetical protein